MQDNSPSQHVQEACPSRCTLPYSQRPAALPPLSISLSTSLPLFFSPILQTQCEPLEREGRNRRGANGQWRSCVGVRRDLQDWDLREEEKGSSGDGGVRRVRGELRCVEKTGHLSSQRWGGGDQWAWNNGDNKSLLFHPGCLTPSLPFSLFPHHLYLPDLPQRIMGHRGRLKQEGRRAEQPVGRDWCRRRSVSLFAHQHILADSRWPVRQQVI